MQYRESKVNLYATTFPVLFEKSSGDFMYDRFGKKYIDFFCGAGALNYGHNPPELKQALIAFLQADGITHSLDMATVAKQQFLQKFNSVILQPRGLDLCVQFTGPTGANGVEAALKLARKVKNRTNIIAFTQGYHGLSSGALSVTADRFYRHQAWTNRLNVSFLPYDGYMGPNVDTASYLLKVLEDSSSGVDIPAAIILETVQAEGGVNVASNRWLQEVAKICAAYDILLIVDDVQVGCGRTGTFFSFESAGIKPDMVVLSKSISGYGLPMTILLLRPDIDQWKPGEHTGTFRGNNLAFVAATVALRYWENPSFKDDILMRGKLLGDSLDEISHEFSELTAVRGKGMIFGLEFSDPMFCAKTAQEAFARNLIIETCGSKRNVLKFLPSLTIDEANLKAGISIVREAIRALSVRK